MKIISTTNLPTMLKFASSSGLCALNLNIIQKFGIIENIFIQNIYKYRSYSRIISKNGNS